MQLTPREYVGRALTVLEDSCRAPLYAAAGNTVAELRDALSMLGFMLDRLDALFPSELKRREARSYIHELRTVRNKFAHAEHLDLDDAYRAADTVARLSKLLGANEEPATSLKRELRGLDAQASTFKVPSADPRSPSRSVSEVMIIACSKGKQPHAAPATELYAGRVFKKSLEVARSDGRRILILSTKYGVIDPTTVLQPYELSSQDLTASERGRLIDLMATQLAPLLDGGLTRLFLLGGLDYLRMLREALRNRGVVVEQHPQWPAVRKHVFG